MNTGSTHHAGIVGLGYVGLPLALAMAESGFGVTGVDIDETRVKQLRSAHSYVEDISGQRVRDAVDESLAVTTEYESLKGADIVSICVPTPLDKTNRPDLSYVRDTAQRLTDVVSDQCVVVLESTVYPGATEEIIASTFQKAGFTIGEDVYVAFSPERVDPGNETYDLVEIPKVLGGVTPECGDRAQAIYEQVFDEIVRVSSAQNAELTKLIENTFRSVNIALVNELTTVAHEIDADIWETINAAKTKPFGFMPFYPGPGLGGHCLPIDPLYLSWEAGNHGTDVEFIELADEINRGMPEYVVRRVIDILNDHGHPIPESDVLILGLSYKAGISDTRESPAFDVIGRLQDRGATITVSDPHVPEIQVSDERYRSVDLTPELVSEHDCTVVLVDHEEFDLELVVETAPVVFDTRNATKDSVNVYRL